MMEGKTNQINKPDDVTKCLLDSLHNPEFCDIKIVGSDGGVIAASKLLLRLRSSYFHCMFSQQSNFVESRDATVELPFTKAVLEKLVRYLYSGQLACEDMSLHSLRELMRLFDFVNLPNEFSSVESFTREKVNLGKFSLLDCVEALDNPGDSITETLQSIVPILERLEPIGK